MMGMTSVGTEDKRKLIIASVFGLLAIGMLIYTLRDSFGGSDSPAPVAPVVTTGRPVATNTVSPAAMATARVTPSKLDPTLHPEGMLLTESLAYAGNGRNIFLAGSVLTAEAVAKIPKAIASPRFVAAAPVATGPPPPPPIDLRFFGTATRKDGTRQAFLLKGEDVFVAGTGDVVSRRYKIGAISLTTVEVTDMTNNNTQRLPMSLQ
jgi:hypothetical protein